MPSKRTVGQLADEAGLDHDEALVTLWDIGLESVGKAADTVPPSHLSRARRALGLASKAQLESASYWRNRLDLTEPALRDLLAKEGLHLAPSARTLPKGGVSVMRRYERSGDRVLRVPSSVAEPSRREKTDTASPPPLQWRQIGRVKEMKYLTADEVAAIHQRLFEDFLTSDNPIDTPGTRSDDLLASACGRPLTGQGDTRKYPTVEMAASALVHSVVNNHPFWNGNKRTALVAFLVFLDENGLVPTCTDEDLFRFVLRVSQHRIVPRDWPDLADREVLEMASWTRANTRLIAKGERPIKWHRLRRVLADFGCACEVARNVGNRINITREVETTGRLGFGSRTKTLRVQVGYADEGREVDRDSIRHLRAQLWLDEEHGVDSAAFYEGDARSAGEFILQYRRILRKLARL